MPQDLPGLNDEIPSCLIKVVKKSKCLIRVHPDQSTRAERSQTLDLVSTLHDRLELCSCSAAKWTFSSPWKTHKLEHRLMLIWLYYCTSAHSHGPGSGRFGTVLPSMRLIDPGQPQDLHWGSSFHGESFGCFHREHTCSLPCLKWEQMSVFTPKGRKRATLCAWW